MTVGRGCGRFKAKCSGSLKADLLITGRSTGPKSNAEVGFAGSVPANRARRWVRKPIKLGLTSVVRIRNKMPPRPHNGGVAARLPSTGFHVPKVFRSSWPTGAPDGTSAGPATQIAQLASRSANSFRLRANFRATVVGLSHREDRIERGRGLARVRRGRQARLKCQVAELPILH
jgi:hypothetical protein